MTLTKAQIEQLFEFTRKKYVHFYDVQVELVDHLAATIEATISENPSLSFEQALQKVYGGFGIFGFAKVVQEKEKAVEKHNNRLWKKAIISYFTLPKIALTLLVFVLCYWISSLLPFEYVSSTVVVIWGLFLVYQIRFIRKEKKIKLKKPLLIHRDPMLIGSPGFILYQLIISNNSPFHNPWAIAIIGVFIFVGQSAVNQVYKTVRNQALTLYPEAFEMT